MSSDCFDDVTILWGARFDYQEDWILVPHCHPDFYQIIYCISGSAIAEIRDDSGYGFNEYRLEPSTLLFLKPSVVHGLRDVCPDGLKTLDMKFLVNTESLRNKLSSFPSVMDINDDNIRLNLDSIRREADQEDVEYHTYCQLLLGIVLVRLIRLTSPRTTHQNLISDIFHCDDLSPQLTRIVAFIENNFDKRITAETWERSLNYSYRQLCNFTKDGFGLTPKDLLEEYRVLQAKAKLAISDMEIKQISDWCGYPNIHHFSRSFKRIVGIPPGEYRAKAREGINKELHFGTEFVNVINVRKV